MSEKKKRNVLDALEQAREDWLEADNELDKERQMIAIDSLLDVATKAGYLTLEASGVSKTEG